jgi:hypothetical protein
MTVFHPAIQYYQIGVMANTSFFSARRYTRAFLKSLSSQQSTLILFHLINYGILIWHMYFSISIWMVFRNVAILIYR